MWLSERYATENKKMEEKSQLGFNENLARANSIIHFLGGRPNLPFDRE